MKVEKQIKWPFPPNNNKNTNLEIKNRVEVRI